MVDYLKDYAAEPVHRRGSLRRGGGSTGYARPFTKESLLYREIFEKYYPGQAGDGGGLLDAQQETGRAATWMTPAPGF